MLKFLQLNFILTLCLLAHQPTYSQSLEEDKVDEFTGNSIKRTSWEILNQTMKFNAFTRISEINGNVYLDLKLMTGKVFAIDEGDEFMLKLNNDEILKLQNLKYEITCTGCGARGYSGSQAQGLSVVYLLSKDQIDKLLEFGIMKIRIYTTDGYLEEDLKTKNSNVLMNSLKLLNP